MLTGAPGYIFLVANGYLFGCKVGALVAAVTKRLVLATPTGTPPIRAWCRLFYYGGFLGYYWLFHTISLV